MGYKEEQAVLNTQTEVPCPGGGRNQRCKLSDIDAAVGGLCVANHQKIDEAFGNGWITIGGGF